MIIKSPKLPVVYSPGTLSLPIMSEAYSRSASPTVATTRDMFGFPTQTIHDLYPIPTHKKLSEDNGSFLNSQYLEDERNFGQGNELGLPHMWNECDTNWQLMTQSMEWQTAPNSSADSSTCTKASPIKVPKEMENRLDQQVTDSHLKAKDQENIQSYFNHPTPQNDVQPLYEPYVPNSNDQFGLQHVVPEHLSTHVPLSMNHCIPDLTRRLEGDDAIPTVSIPNARDSVKRKAGRAIERVFQPQNMFPKKKKSIANLKASPNYPSGPLKTEIPFEQPDKTRTGNDTGEFTKRRTNSMSSNSSTGSAEKSGTVKKSLLPRLKFSLEEDLIILRLRNKEQLPWRTISRFFENRSAKALQVHYSVSLRGQERPWTKEEDDQLRDLVREHERAMWEVIAKRLNVGIGALGCSYRYQSLRNEYDHDLEERLANLVSEKSN